MATGSVDGLVSGLQTSTVIEQLMSLERQPQARLQTKKESANQVLTVYQALNTKFSTLVTAGQSLSRAADWKVMKASSSDSEAVSPSATSAAQVGSLGFSVRQLSRAGAVVSTGTLAATTAPAATGPVVVAKGADVVGISRLQAAAGLTSGAHTVEVTTATSAAVKSGTTALDASTDLGAGGTIEVTVDGQARTWNIGGGTYATRDSLAAAVQAAADTVGAGEVSVTVGSANELRITTNREGSAASLRITGGTARGALKLTADGSAITGQAGAVKVDGTTVAVTSARAGDSTTLTGTKGSINATFAGGLRVGKVSIASADAGTGSLAALVDGVNRSGAGITAAAVKVGADSYRLQLQSTTSGAASNILVETENLTSTVGSFSTVQSGRDALIRIGEGPGAYDVASATDSMSDVLPGVSLQLRKADPATTVTVTVGRDADALATKVAGLVEAANGAITYIKSQSTYDPSTKKAGVLLSEGMARNLQQQVHRAVTDMVSGNSVGSAGAVGITVARDGSVNFDKAKFLDAYAKDPDAVTDLFRQVVTVADGRLSFLSARASTPPGTYAVSITQPAAQAAATGSPLAGGLAAGETIDVRIGGRDGIMVTYAAAAGATLTEVAAGLNAALTQQSITTVSASVEDGKLVLRSAAYGSAASFEVRTSTTAANQTGIASAPGKWELRTGTDVVGSIDGVAGTGSGQTLRAPSGTSMAGLAVKATAAGDLGTVTYLPGVAERLKLVASEAVEFGTGSISTAISGRQTLIRDLDSRIAGWDVRLTLREQNLRKQFAGLETALGKLKDQSNWLAGQLAGLGGSST